MTLRVRLLGTAQLSHNDQPILMRGYKPLALLAYLLVTGKAQIAVLAIVRQLSRQTGHGGKVVGGQPGQCLVRIAPAKITASLRGMP